VRRGFFFSYQKSFALPDQGSHRESCGGTLVPPAIYSIFTTDHDSWFELPACAGGKALNQNFDPTCGIRVPPELPCMGARCATEAVARSIQYNFTASLRATATLATLAPRRNFNR